MKTNLSYYREHSLFSDPGPHAHLLEGLPDSPQELRMSVQGVLIHRLTAGMYNLTFGREQRGEQYLRTTQERLGRLAATSARPLVESRAPQERLVGTCRDFALLYTALLRHAGIPARMRVGFATYLTPEQPYRIDHWISEYWDAHLERWVLADAQIDSVQKEAFQMRGDPQDLRLGIDFYLAGQAWKLARSGQEKPLLFRYSGHWKGMPCIRGNLLHDFQVLNKVELEPWDYWDDLSRKDETALTVEEKTLLDRIAGLTLAPDSNFPELQELFETLPRTAQIRSRIRLMGIGPAQQVTADRLRPSPSERLAELSQLNGREKNGGEAVQTNHRPVLPEEPYEIPEGTPLAALQQREGLGSYGLSDIQVRGARQHNLKHIDVRIPRNKLVVITGVSGSGKSSLAFDTIYAEGQRRYLESLSSYARQFVGQMEKPQVDQITGLSPAIAIEQKTISKNPRSTVGTVTEIHDYLRVLYARVGLPHCPQCGRAVQPQSAHQIMVQLAGLPQGTRFQVLAPVVRGRKGVLAGLLRQARKDGYTRARVDGEPVDLASASSLPELDKNKKHDIELVVDRLQIPEDPDDPGFRTRLLDSVETALRAANGLVVVSLEDEELVLSEHNACPNCDLSFPELQPNLFSFNSPFGMCPECNGLGVKLQVDPELVITQPQLSLLDGASPWFGNLRKKQPGWTYNVLTSIAEHYGADLEQPWENLPEEFRQVLLYGSGGAKMHFKHASQDGSWKGESYRDVKGILYNVNRLFRQTRSEYTRRFYMQFLRQLPCPKCLGERLCPEARFVTVDGRRLPELTSDSLADLYDWIEQLPTVLNEEQRQVGEELILEIRQRLQFLRNVGLHYLALDRPAPTLSGGEGQRIRLASQIGSGLVGVLYILDEPSIGLHNRDHRALLDTLAHLRNIGNTVLVVEHDAETMRTADWLIDLGPGPGVLGGEVVAAGTPEEVMAHPASLTGRYLSGELQVTPPNGKHRRNPTGWLTLTGARLHNLKQVSVRLPLGTMIGVTGVSGSGKSSLVAQTLYPLLARALNKAQAVPGPYETVEGLEQLDKVIHISQDPIGRNPRSNPGTYVGVLSEIRRVFAETPEAKALGYGAGRFSFNVKGGRCEACAGYGFKKVEMHFLPDVWVRCKDCDGRQFNRQTLEIRFKGKNIAEVLDMDVQEALEFFTHFPQIQRILQTLHDVGLDYIKLGQSALTLSGGEAQRVKLAKELSRAATGRTVYFLDEPTTGLHFADIQRLLDVLHRLVDAGNTVLIIEHNLDVIRSCDWLVDLGPEGGEQGGYIVAEGPPEAVSRVKTSHTGRALRQWLGSESNKAELAGI